MSIEVMDREFRARGKLSARRFWLNTLLTLSLLVAHLAVPRLWSSPTLNVSVVHTPVFANVVGFSGIDAPAILQRSTDLTEWTDLLLVTADFNGEELQATIGAGVKASFYRLKPLSEPLRIQMNMVPESAHLAKIVSGSEVDIDVFGTRDADGYPLVVTSISYRVGSRLILTEKFAANDTRAPPSQAAVVPENSFVHYVSGYVIVETDGGCEISGPTPIVQFRNTEFFPPGNLRDRSGEIQCEFDHLVIGTGQLAYRYRVPFFWDLPPPTDLQRALNGLRSALSGSSSGLAGFSNSLLSTAGEFLIGAEASANLSVAPSGPAADSIGFATAGLATIDGALDNQPFDARDDQGSVTVVQINVRAIIPTGKENFVYSSGWQTMNYPAQDQPAPTLIITVPCQSLISIIPQDSHVRTGVDLNKNGQVINEEGRLTLLETFNGSASNGVYLVHSDPLAYASSNINVTATDRFVVCSATIDVTFFELHDVSVWGTGKADSKTKFQIAPFGGYGNGSLVEVELRTSYSSPINYNSPIVLTGRLGRYGTPDSRTITGEGVFREWVRVGDVYYVDFESLYRTNATNQAGYRQQSKLVFTLLGQRRQ